MTATATATATAVLKVAAKEIGYFQKPGSRTKFGSWYGIPNGQWCAMFVSWCANEAGAASIIPKHAYTPNGVQWFKDHKAWHRGTTGIKVGDVVYFDFPGAPNRVSHVGLVSKVHSDGSVSTIEGNTSGTAGGDQRNGGVVALKRRKSYIVGYGRPAYARPTPTAKDTTKETAKDTTKETAEDTTTKRWQKFLNDTFPAYAAKITGGMLAEDNLHGAHTTAWTKMFQKNTGLPRTGVLDDRTRRMAKKFGFTG